MVHWFRTSSRAEGHWGARTSQRFSHPSQRSASRRVGPVPQTDRKESSPSMMNSTCLAQRLIRSVPEPSSRSVASSCLVSSRLNSRYFFWRVLSWYSCMRHFACSRGRCLQLLTQVGIVVRGCQPQRHSSQPKKDATPFWV